MKRFLTLSLFSALTFAGCATRQGVDFEESARLLGRENDVRVDAQISTMDVGAGSSVSIVYEVENLREAPIAIADLVPEVSYDPETGIITVLLGSEVPGNQLLPRLDVVRPGERKAFRAGSNLGLGTAARRNPRSIRIRLSYLKEVEPFGQLLDMEEKALYDPELADALFLPWVENVQFVTTNEIPLNWTKRLQPPANPLPGRD
ncbi:MAG: hypothetical protein R3338_00280 [Thermoanaerobaculia bacterium]|nr:hypothetical protein [Thermoanaerobaculia bacterium]